MSIFPKVKDVTGFNAYRSFEDMFFLDIILLYSIKHLYFWLHNFLQNGKISIIATSSPMNQEMYHEFIE